jgi:hypothetical protein
LCTAPYLDGTRLVKTNFGKAGQIGVAERRFCI